MTGVLLNLGHLLDFLPNVRRQQLTVAQPFFFSALARVLVLLLILKGLCKHTCWLSRLLLNLLHLSMLILGRLLNLQLARLRLIKQTAEIIKVLLAVHVSLRGSYLNLLENRLRLLQVQIV
jgi:hypothetical protein